MRQPRNNRDPATSGPKGTTTGKAKDPAKSAAKGAPLSARSVVASTLLGAEAAHLPGRHLVAAAELFGITEGTTRVALSRMVAAGELVTADGSYGLAGPLLERQARQSASRRASRTPWSAASGQWTIAVVAPDRRAATDRIALREAMRRLKVAELREGVWTRPDNLPAGRAPAAEALVAEQCHAFVGRPVDDADALALARDLWDLAAWAATAQDLRTGLATHVDALEQGDTSVLVPAFELSAAVLRHLLADPLLPDPLLPPDWPGHALRDDYDRYDRAFKALWRDWFRAQRAAEQRGG